MATTTERSRPTNTERRAQTRSALLESAARGLARYGYGDLVLERVAGDAGYTRGALYHLFDDKQDLALAVVAWAGDIWQQEVGHADQEAAPVPALIALARGHAVYCRRDVAQASMVMRLEFGDRDHPVGRAVEQQVDTVIERCARLITAGRLRGTIPSGPPGRTLARASVGGVEGAVSRLVGKTSNDELVAERVVRGVLGLDSTG